MKPQHVADIIPRVEQEAIVHEEVLDLDVKELSNWFYQEGDDSWWTIDGETVLTGMLTLPCIASDIGNALEKHGGRIRIFLSADEEGGRIFKVAWISDDGTIESPWFIVEDNIAREAYGIWRNFVHKS